MARLPIYENIAPIENNFTVKFRTYLGRTSLFSHWHEHIELLLFLDGSCDFITGGKTFSVEKNDFIIVNSTEVHSFTATPLVDHICILIYPEFFSDIKFPSIQFRNLIRNDEFIVSLITEMYDEYSRNDIGSDMLLKSHAYKLMAYLLRNYAVSHMSQRDIATQNAKLARLGLIVEYISNNYQKKITTSQLAEMTYLNENHFCRFFKKAVGKTVSEYINEYRVERAAVLLSATDASVTDVANAVGFDDINYFSRIFKRTKGISPTEYRKKQA